MAAGWMEERGPELFLDAMRALEQGLHLEQGLQQLGGSS